MWLGTEHRTQCPGLLYRVSIRADGNVMEARKANPSSPFTPLDPKNASSPRAPDRVHRCSYAVTFASATRDLGPWAPEIGPTEAPHRSIRPVKPAEFDQRYEPLGTPTPRGAHSSISLPKGGDQ